MVGTSNCGSTSPQNPALAYTCILHIHVHRLCKRLTVRVLAITSSARSGRALVSSTEASTFIHWNWKNSRHSGQSTNC